MRTTRIALLLASLLGLAFAGCSADVGVPSTGSFLDEVSADTEPLATSDEDEWEDAPAGCEGLLDGSIHFELAQGTDGRLLVAIDLSGEVICTDTLAGIQDELVDAGRVDEARDLACALAVTIGTAVPSTGADSVRFDPTGDDPSPQPSHPSSMGSMGSSPSQPADPSPQPS
ncbi:MAG: hypothetical protein AB7S26_28410 [Sandaracinaceae bacterium]